MPEESAQPTEPEASDPETKDTAKTGDTENAVSPQATDGSVSASKPTDGAITKTPGKTGLAARRSRWKSSADALKYLSTLDRKKFRQTDKYTAGCLAASLVVAAAVLFAPATMTGVLACIVDILLGLTVLFFIANRFGIITILGGREAILVFDLIVGVFFLGLFFALNLFAVLLFIRTFLGA